MSISFKHAGVMWSASCRYDPGTPPYRLDDPDLAEEGEPEEIEITGLWRWDTFEKDWRIADWVLDTSWAEDLLQAAMAAAKEDAR